MKSSAIQFLKRSRFKLQVNLRQVHKVTEYRSGCVYKTRTLGYIICSPDYTLSGAQIGSVSTSVSRQLL